MAEKLADRLDEFEKKNKRLKKELKKGTDEEKAKKKKEYDSWLKSEAYNHKHNRRMIDVLVQDSYNTKKIAARMIKGYLPDVYALNANYGAYEIDSLIGFDTSWTLYSREAVERLIRDNPALLPKVDVKKGKEQSWNRKKLLNEITQGMLQGESVQDMAKRLGRVMEMNRDQAIRNARTATTSAQNGGRMNAYRRAEELGIGVTKVWIAAMDAHTRSSHRVLDGQKRPLEEPFDSAHGPIMQPGDPMADPAEVYNCRCKIRALTKYSDYDPTDLEKRFVRFEGTPPTYEEWKAGKNGGDEIE